MKPRRLKQFLLILLIGLLFFGSPQKALGRDGSDSQANLLLDGQLHSEVQALQSKVHQDGEVQVIVTLDIKFIPEGELQSISAVQSQRSGIQQAQQGLISRLQLGPENTIRNFKYIPIVVLQVNESQLHALLQDPAVSYVEEVGLDRMSLDETIPFIGADDAWAAGYTGAGQVVAILDTGVDSSHVFVTDKVISEACFSDNNGTGAGTSVCPDSTGTEIGTGTGTNCNVTGCDHGTHVAGIAAGKGVSFSGVAKDANIIAIQVFTEFEGFTYCGNGPDPCVLSYNTDVAAALEHVYSLRNSFNIAAVNLSLGSGEHSTESECYGDLRRTPIVNLKSVGIATIAASGNDDYRTAMNAPACIAEAISVGATDETDAVASFSNVASFLDFYAPGDWYRPFVFGIYSSIPGGYGYKSGTSMATPHVTGAWAVMKSKAPNSSVEFIYDALSSTGVFVDDNRAGGTVDDIPRIQLDAAIDSIRNLHLPIIYKETTP